MFGLIRLAVLLPLTFVAGMLFERLNASEACTGAGGTLDDGVCWHE